MNKKFPRPGLIIKIYFLSFSFFLLTPLLQADEVSSQIIKHSDYFSTGNTLRLHGDYEQAINAFSQSLKLAEKKGDKKAEIESLLNLGILFWNTGSLKESSQYLKQALETAREIKEESLSGLIIDYLQIYEDYLEGKKFRARGEFEKSIDSFIQAIKRARKIKSPEHELKSLRQLSVTYWRLNNLQKFYRLNREALNIARNINHKKEEGRCLNNIGLYWEKTGDYSQALKHYEQALKIAEENKDLEEQSNCVTNISNVYNYIGNLEKALEYTEKALFIDKKLEKLSYIALDLNNIGNIYRQLGIRSENKIYFYEALKYFKRCLDLSRKANNKETEILALNNIGTVNIDLGGYNEALEYLKAALEISEKTTNKDLTCLILNNMGIASYNDGNLEDSIKYLQKSIDLGLEIKGGQILWEAYLEMGNAYRKEKEYEKALESYKNSINIIEDIRSKIKLEELKASYFGTDRRLEAFHNLIDLLARLHQSHSGKEYDLQAFNYMERAKARSFLDSLEVSNIDISAGVDLRLIEREKELMQEISKIYKTLLSPDLTEEKRNELYSQLKKHEEEIESVKREIRISSPAYADLKYPQIISVKEAQKKLADRTTAFFEYCLGRENSYAFVITRNRLNIFPLPPAREIQKKVKNYLSLITDRECSEFQPGYELFSSLILPGLDKKIRKIIISPDDILHFLPFEALITQQKPRKWLIEDYRVAYVPSLSALSEIKNHKKMKKQRPRKDLIAFGDPSFGVNEITNSEKDIFQDYYSSNTFNFFRLEHSSQEVERIGSLFKKSKKLIYRRENASEELIKKIPLSQYKILHFATHALVDEKNPARSAIVLSLKNNDNEDGFLQMREIFNLDLNCDLVTLSACQTGLGEFIRGEGIESLNRAFFYAGSSSALITLWAVNDQASAILMERFYSYLRYSCSIMEALRKAKLEMISSGNLSHPYFWAGYLATGMADRIIFPSSSKKLFILLSLFLTGAGIITFRNLHRKM